MNSFSRLALLAASVALPLGAQKTYTAQDYAQAEKYMGYNLNSLVKHTVGGVSYLPDGRVFYRVADTNSTVYMLADPKTGQTAQAFDSTKLAAAFSSASRRGYTAQQLGITSYKPEANGGFAVSARSITFHCDAAGTTCTQEAPAPGRTQQPRQRPSGQPPAGNSSTETGGNAQMAGRDQPANAQGTQGGTQPGARPAAAPARPAVGRSRAPFDVSPDGKYEAFIRDWNLWVRDVKSGDEKQLTTDGVTDFGYATDNAGWQHSDSPILVWSPDSKMVATFQQDQRNIPLEYNVEVTYRHPKVETWRYPFLGDKEVVMISPVVIDVASAHMTRLKMDPEFHRSTLCDDVSCRGGAGWDDVQWAEDGKSLALASSSRDHKDVWLRVANTGTGEVRTVYHEHAPTYFESGLGKVNWRYLPKSNEFLWFSQRSDWGQMYLYDLTTGKLKNEVTRGVGTVAEVLNVDQTNRVVYFTATGKEKDHDPYFSHFYRAGFDGTGQQLLTPENADHAVTPSPDGATFIDIYSTVQTPRTAVLRSNTGKVLATLGTQDISALQAFGWQPPTPFTVPARDGKTTLYGFMWKPMHMDASRKYPLIDYVYPGPQTGSCGSRSFAASERDNQSLAELGFVVVCIDGMGTPHRSKSFQDAYATTPADIGLDTIPDQVAGIRDLAKRYTFIDLDHVGIWGHSGGGNATVAAMFRFADFFKVGIAESGNHDSRGYEDDWLEKYSGLETIGPDGKSNYDAQANQDFAGNLKGHLLLAHGTSDDNVPPNLTLTVVDRLIKANKDFDLIMIPNAHHGYGEASQYMMRRRWDYFVRYLAGGTPPLNYQVKPYAEVARAQFGGPGGTEGPDDPGDDVSDDQQ